MQSSLVPPRPAAVGQRARTLLGAALATATALASTQVEALAAQSIGSPPSPDAPRGYEAPLLPEPPVIDGRLEEAAWAEVPWSDPFIDIRGTEWPAPTWATRMKIAWDEGHLYVGAWLEEPHLWATLTERDAIIYHDHDFEIFLDPDGDGLAYFELEVNALGTEFDLFLDRPYSEGGRAHIDWNMAGVRTAVGLEGSLNDPTDVDVGWGVEIAIPWTDLTPPASHRAPAGERSDGAAHGRPPEPGDRWRVNFSRVQWPLVVEDGSYRRERLPVDWSDHPEDNWVWSPQGAIDMHIPERWGVVTFTAGGR